MPKAAVLPVPVCACPMTSLPSRSGGMESACMGVGSSKPISETALITSLLRPKSSKLAVFFSFNFFPFPFFFFSFLAHPRPRALP